MPVQVNYPGVYVEELPGDEHFITGVPTAVTAFIGRTLKGAINEPVQVNSFADFETSFGGLDQRFPLSYALRDFFFNGGSQALIVRLVHGDPAQAQGGQPLAPEDYLGDQAQKTGLYALDKAESCNLLCIPPDVIYPQWQDIDELVWQTAANICMRRSAFLIVDPPGDAATGWLTKLQNGAIDKINPLDLGIAGDPARYAAVYFPPVMMEDPKMAMQVRPFPACGIIAGIYAATDASVGVWKAPAGLSAAIQGIKSLQVNLNDAQNGVLNPQGINCLRSFDPGGPVVWGARTLQGQDALDDDFKYVPVRRLANYIELSIQRGTQWALFEPNDESLWSALRVSIGDFLQNLKHEGGISEYAVICDASTTTPADIAEGVVNVMIMYDPGNQGEFTVLQFQISGLPAA